MLLVLEYAQDKRIGKWLPNNCFSRSRRLIASKEHLSAYTASEWRGFPFAEPISLSARWGSLLLPGHWLGALGTPWSVLGILAAGDKRAWPEVQIGEIMPVTLPGGAFHFLGMHEPAMGSFLACSLMSPIERLYRQKDVENFALKALNLMMTPSRLSEKSAEPNRSALRRRDFFAPEAHEKEGR